MSGISKKRYRRPAEKGRWYFGRGGLPKPITDELGLAFSEWGFVEQQMDALLSVAVGKPLIGKILRENVRTSKARLAILSDLVKASAPADMQADVLGLLGAFVPLAAERGLFAHGIWGTHEAHPDEAILLIDDSFIQISHPDLDQLRASPEPLLDRVRENTAVVSVRDVVRFRQALKRLRERLTTMVFEMQLRQRTEAARAQLGRGAS